MNQTFLIIIRFLRSCLVLPIFTPFALSEWLTQSLLIGTDLIKVK